VSEARKKVSRIKRKIEAYEFPGDLNSNDDPESSDIPA
jgi:hypothetical protein